MKPVRLLAITLLGATLAAHAESPTTALEKEARELIKAFAGELKPALQSAMQQGGPAEAVKVCSEKAPAIATRLSEESGWQVKRVSLKPRNPDAAPDAFEEKQLKGFNLRRKNGESPANINTGQMTDNGYRYMQAQGVEPLCLSCHGKQIDPATQKALEAAYPGDKATGYSLGEIRGAFSLQKTSL